MWSASYNEGGLRFSVKGTTTNECPASLVTEKSMGWLSLFAHSKEVKSATGKSIFSDFRRWPARDIAAMVILQHEQGAVESAYMKAAQKRRTQDG